MTETHIYLFIYLLIYIFSSAHHLQRPGMRMQQQQQQQQQMAANPASPQGQGQRPIMVERLQRLQLEKELLKKRQEEIARQVCTVCHFYVKLRSHYTDFICH